MLLKDKGDTATVTVNCENELITLENPKIKKIYTTRPSYHFSK